MQVTTKRLTMPSDYMSEKERKALNGVVQSYQLNTPKTWEEFKSMPPVIQKDYLKGLIGVYNAKQYVIAKMFGIACPTFSKYCSRVFESKQLFPLKRQKFTEDDRKRWQHFLDGAFSGTANAEVQLQKEAILNEASHEEPDGRRSLDSRKMIMSDFSLSFIGIIDPQGICNSLLQILGTESEGTIEIIFKGGQCS